MGKKSRQRQRQKQQQQQLPPPPQTLWEDPASLFPWCSWCGKVDHWWRSCPDGPPADRCGRCELDGHSWAGRPHNPDQEQLQTPSSAATPPLPISPPSPPSQEIWDWLMHPEADLFHDLPIAINTLWRRDGGRWEKWEAEHHPASFAELALMVVNYLAVDMGEAPVKVELSSREPEREELLSQEPEREGEQPELSPPPPPAEGEQPELSLPPPPAEGEQPELSLPASPGVACLSALPGVACLSTPPGGPEGPVSPEGPGGPALPGGPEVPAPPEGPVSPFPPPPPEGAGPPFLPPPPEGPLLLPSPPEGPLLLPSLGVFGDPASPGIARDPASPGVAILWPEPHGGEPLAMKNWGVPDLPPWPPPWTLCFPLFRD
ncbi:UNVERIFIED_CONTAM: hypothetical protein FKN15_054228 [Acipenser sinensis]